MEKSFSPRLSKNKMPLPPDLINLPVIEAEPWCQIFPDIFLEGPAFDREGNLFITSPPNGLIFKITPRKKVNLIFNDPLIKVDGSAFHKDGRLFVVCLSGELLILNPDTGTIECLCPKYKGQKLCMNDLVFDPHGNFYVTHFTGTVNEPTGAVYLISPDAKIVHSIVQHLASPNGISLSPEGNILWVAETTRNAVLRIDLLKDGVTPNPIDGLNYACYLSGCPGPDSNKVDEDGNLYQCLIYQGRAIVLNKHGIPVANVLIPGRGEGLHLQTANMAFKPGTRDGYIVAGGKGGAWIYKFKGLARGLTLFSHQK
jgi:lactonase